MKLIFITKSYLSKRWRRFFNCSRPFKNPALCPSTSDEGNNLTSASSEYWTQFKSSTVPFSPVPKNVTLTLVPLANAAVFKAGCQSKRKCFAKPISSRLIVASSFGSEELYDASSSGSEEPDGASSSGSQEPDGASSVFGSENPEGACSVSPKHLLTGLDG